jgi:hypothetical protein
MTLAGIKTGDIVLCDVRGDQFHARVAARPDELLPIESLTRRPIPSLYVKPRQVIAHWRKSKQSKV